MYNTKKSAFWRLATRISDSFYNKGINSINYIVWNNLYKISKKDNGNPSKALMDIRLPVVKKILHEEIYLYKPKYIIYLTGNEWSKDFFENPNIFINTKEFKYVERIGLDQNTGQIHIVSQHPQGKPENIQFTEIINSIKNLTHASTL